MVSRTLTPADEAAAINAVTTALAAQRAAGAGRRAHHHKGRSPHA